MISAKRSQTKKVSENTFYSLVQHFAIILFECAESDDFSPAKILMNMCFTFYYEGKYSNDISRLYQGQSYDGNDFAIDFFF